MPRTQTARSVAECRNCGAVVPVTVSDDGTLVPIGTKRSGKCGDGEFEVIDGGTLD
ncbi:MAG: hypothetical protein ACI8UR_002269 [Natronomonas sp.]|jgi:hypothetical protein|uniref:hypothetical protein n=1 Tax=Natronomonas sp. TaxID=2184060 RepID=UPI0039891411